ncbi:MAG: squalene/phytoene synthase family protein [Reyranellaceae bacterium]
MPSAPTLSGYADAALKLLQPLVDRLDRAHGEQGRQFFRWLRQLSRGDGDVASEDPRLAPQLALMRQAFAREAAAGEGVLFQNWSDLHNHLRFAVVPFGRAMLALHSEAAIAQPPMDALMLAVGLAAILQQAPQSFRDSGRMLLPVQWFPAGTDIATWLRAGRRSAALDTAYANGLARLEEMLLAAERGLTAIHNEALRQGALATLFLLRRLQSRLALRTPNVRPVAVTFLDRLLLRWRYRRRGGNSPSP